MRQDCICEINSETWDLAQISMQFLINDSPNILSSCISFFPIFTPYLFMPTAFVPCIPFIFLIHFDLLVKQPLKIQMKMSGNAVSSYGFRHRTFLLIVRRYTRKKKKLQNHNCPKYAPYVMQVVGGDREFSTD